jgi:hypothetical protein
MVVPDLEKIGPVDVAVIHFAGSEFNGEVAPALMEAHDSGVVQILDLALLTKDLDGTSGFIEVEDADIAEAFAVLSDGHVELLNDEDLALMADELEPGSSALVVVWQNAWAARLGAAIRGSGGELVAQYRIPREIVVAAVDALAEELT